MRASEGIDQLPGNADFLVTLTNRALQNIPDTKFPTDLLYVDGLSFVRETRITGDDEQPTDARQRGNDLLDHPIGKIFLVGIAAHVLKRHHRYRRLFGKRKRSRGFNRRSGWRGFGGGKA